MTRVPVFWNKPAGPKTRWKTISSVTESNPLKTSSRMASGFREYTARAIDYSSIRFGISGQFNGHTKRCF